MEDGKLTGEVRGPLISGTKDDAMEVVTAVTREDRDTTVAVGDGANDLPMLEVANLAIGFDPKPAVAPSCDTSVETVDELYDLLEAEEILSDAFVFAHRSRYEYSHRFTDGNAIFAAQPDSYQRVNRFVRRYR